MSRYLVPHGFGRNFWDTWNYPQRLADQHFGLGLPLDPFLDSALVPPVYQRCPSLRKRVQNRGGDEKGYSAVQNDDTQFQVKMDCSHFSPEELSVKLVDGSLVVSGKHEEKKDEHGFISREFTRRYALPKDVELDKITTSLNSSGVLTLTAPKKQPEAIKGNERVIPITMVSNAAPVAIDGSAVASAENQKEEEKMEG